VSKKLAFLFAATWAVCACAGSAMAQQGSVAPPTVSTGVPVYQGTAFVIGVSDGCASSVPAVGDYYTMLYRAFPETGNTLYGGGIAFVTPISSVSYVLPAGVSLLGGYQTFPSVSAHGESSDVGPFNYTGSLNLTIAPALLTPSTSNVYITGTVGDIFGYAGCTVTIRAALALRP
jgi:hypothetical protein